jgi:hypothetical protein
MIDIGQLIAPRCLDGAEFAKIATDAGLRSDEALAKQRVNEKPLCLDRARMQELPYGIASL